MAPLNPPLMIVTFLMNVQIYVLAVLKILLDSDQVTTLYAITAIYAYTQNFNHMILPYEVTVVMFF